MLEFRILLEELNFMKSGYSEVGTMLCEGTKASWMILTTRLVGSYKPK